MGSVSRRAIGGSIHRIREFELEKVRLTYLALSDLPFSSLLEISNVKGESEGGFVGRLTQTSKYKLIQ